MINYMFEESQYETENSETSIGKIVKDEIQVNNIIAVPCRGSGPCGNELLALSSAPWS